MRDFDGLSIIRQIFRGGMTDLFVATHPAHGRVILRILKEAYARERRLRKNFLHSAKILSHLNHPNIVRLFDYGENRQQPYMVMEYVESRTLRDLLVQRDPLMTQNRLSLIRQMAAALHHIHYAGYLHLDFKPENLLVREDGHVVLIDFDLIQKHGRSPVRIHEYPGTPAYVAPEVMTLQRADERADIYSFGVTCYEMLTFHKPFERDTLDEARAAQIDPDTTPTPITAYTADAPPALAALILKCLAKDVNSRYPAMSLVIKNLESLL